MTNYTELTMQGAQPEARDEEAGFSIEEDEGEEFGPPQGEWTDNVQKRGWGALELENGYGGNEPQPEPHQKRSRHVDDEVGR